MSYFPPTKFKEIISKVLSFEITIVYELNDTPKGNSREQAPASQVARNLSTAEIKGILQLLLQKKK